MEIEEFTFKQNNNASVLYQNNVKYSVDGEILNDDVLQGCPRINRTGHTGPELMDEEVFQINSESDSDDTPLLISPQDPNMSSLNNNCHCHVANGASRKHADKAKKKLIIALGLCLLFIAGEIVGAYLSGSLAIMSDAAHMFSDFASFLISLLAIHLGSRKPSKKFTFGLLRAEALGALFTVMIIWFASGVLLFLAIHRLSSGDFAVEPDPMIAVATCAVIFNIVLGLLLNGVPHNHGHSHGGGGGGHKHSHLEGTSETHINLRAAVIHVLGDLIQSIGVLISSVIIKIWPEYKKADPACTVLFSIIVFFTTVTILRDTVLILLESKPHQKDYEAIYNDLLDLKHVVRLHDLHIWSLTTDQQILSVHLAVENHSEDKEEILQSAIQMLRSRHGINKCTIQIEDYNATIMNDCQQCELLP